MTTSSVTAFFGRNRFIYNRWIFISGVFAVALNLGLWGVLGWKVRFAHDLIPLHYNIYFNVDYFGSKYALFGISGWATGVLLLNLFLGWWVYERNRLLSIIFVVIAALAQIIFFLAGWLISTLPVFSV